MTVIARYECPTGHGDSLTALREQEPNRWCAVCQTWVEPVLVEYVDATTHQGAVDLLRDLVGNSGHLCDPPRIEECAKCRAEAFLASLDNPGGQ